MNEIIFENIVRILKMGKQCIIFAHKRAETYSTAVELIEILKQRNKYLSLFDCENSYRAKKDVSSSRNEQVKELF
jgi:replicative superfamily II helicase